MPRRKKRDAGLDMPGLDFGASGLDLGDGPAIDIGGGMTLDIPDLGLGGDADDEHDPATGDLEVDSRAELEELKSDFQKRSKQEEKRREQITDSEFWCAFCFETREQKEEFLLRLKLLDLGDKYIDGPAAARILGVPLEQPRMVWPRIRVNRRLVDLT
jgi:hypothetical protein